MSLHKEYYDNGILKSEGKISNNLKEGLWIYYKENGIKEKEINFKKNLENGQWRMWNENGTLYIEQNKVNGKSEGYWKEYYDDGRIKEIGEYIKDKYYPIDFWDENGIQLLKGGNGKKIEKFGFSGLDVYEHYFENKIFIKEVKIF